ncbi:MAG: hypothetical protein IJX26_01160 [Clostridia bacterium]|nr:hypothetical protein [Clostridia bacterium]
MKKLKKIISPRTLLLIASVIIFVSSISFINLPSQSSTQGIVSVLAVDTDGSQVDVACSIITPTGGRKTKSNVYSAKAPTIAQAIQKVSIQIGKTLGFAQCDVVAVGNNIMEQNIVSALDYLTRTRKVNKNVLLLNFDGIAKEFIESVIYIEENLSLKLSELLAYNKENIMAIDSSVEKFYLGYYSDSGISMLPTLSLKEESENGIQVEVSASQSSSSLSTNTAGGDGESEEKPKKLYLVNDGTASVLKNGKKISTLYAEEVKNINLFINESTTGTFKLENVTDKLFDNATIVMAMEEKDLNYKYMFKDDTPLIELTIDMYVKVEEIIQEKSEKMLRREDNFITDELVSRLKEKVEGRLNDAVEYMKEKNVDLIEIYNWFNKFNNKKWKNYINSLEDKEDYIKNVDFKFKINVAQYL